MNSIVRQYAGLTPEKRALFKRLLIQQGIDPLSLILPQDRTTNSFPLSFAQQRLWFLDQFEPGSPVYNIPTAIRMIGAVSETVLSRCLKELARRHESLRTVFQMIDTEGRQVILPEVEIPLEVVDLSHLPPDRREEEALRLMNEEAQRTFDLTQPPLLRVTLYRLAPTEHIALLVIHHIISDGWSMGVLVREMTGLYTAFAAGLPSPLPELDIQYADYSVWQREWMQGERFQEQVNYWKSVLGDLPPPLELPTTYPRPPYMTSNGAAYTFDLPAEDMRALTQLCKQHNATVFMGLTALLEVLLYRYTGQNTFCLGTPIANRTRVEVENLIGFFVNTLVLRADLDAGMDFTALLNRVRETALGAFAHQDLPFEILTEMVQSGRDTSRPPVFQVSLAVQNTPQTKIELPGLTIEEVPIHTGTSKFDLSFFFSEDPETASGTIEYNADLFSPEFIQSMADHFCVLLKNALAHPNMPIGRLPMITQEERRQILEEWNATQHPFVEGVAHRAFEEWVERQPDAPALIFQGQSLTYAELNRRANVLARRLQQMGIGPEKVAGVLIHRGFDLITAILAVYKAGGGYLPLEPTYPAERLDFMLADSQASVLITDPALRDRVTPGDIPVICLDAQELSEKGADPELGSNFACPAGPDNLAYIIYTSGSTGKPKGVLLQQRGLCNLVEYLHHTFDIEPGSRVLQFSSACFDVSVWDIFMALGNGGTLVLAPIEILASGPHLAQLLKDESVHTATLVPSVLGFLPYTELPLLKNLIVAGEACPAELVREWGPGRKFYNGYGPTETTVISSLALCDPDDPLPPSIGRPVDNTRLYILDPQGELLPAGIPGELYIGGVGVARGYLNRPDLTAERFLPDPFSSEPGARMYKTGDLARWRFDGTVEYLGRLDNQVKLRGFRIELGEIENTLIQYAGVQQAVVTARDDGPNNSKRLVAYIVPETPETQITPGELRDHIKARLPDYMVPSVFVFLDKLPLTGSKKVDRKALPAPTEENILETPAGKETIQAHFSPIEEMVADVWKQVLGLSRIGRNDNFFEIGGHSILATQLNARVSALFQIDLPLRTVFEKPTLSAYAGVVQSLLRENRAHPASKPVKKVDHTGPIPLSYSQQRLWFLDQFEPGSPVYNVPVALRLKGALDADALQHSLDTLTQRHSSLRTVFHAVDGIPHQVVLPSAGIEIERIDLSALDESAREENARQIIRERARESFDLQRGPLLRASLIRMGEDDHIAVFNAHHIITDGWSMGVLVGELAALYNARVSGEEAYLPELPIQYTDFSIWQRDWLQSESLDRLLDYWKEQLKDIPETLDLPTDHPRPAVQTSNGGRLSFFIDEDLVKRLKAFCQKEHVTPFMALLSVFQILLYRYTGQEDFCVGTPIANRSRAEIEPLIGLFINTLVLRSDLSGQPDFRTLVQRVRETSLGAYAHQDLPFEILVDALQPERSTNRSPLFQVMFLMQNAPVSSEAFQGLEAEWLDLDPGTAMFDLTLVMEETPGGMFAGLEYNSDLFEVDTIERMGRHFTALLEAALSQPDQPVAALKYMDDAEQREVLVELNDTYRPDPRLDQTYQRLFEQQVLLNPKAVAVFEPRTGRSLTYSELNARANQLARYLKRAGVGPDTIAAVSTGRTLEMCVSLLGILKAGGAYLPIDPAYPDERIQFMLEDSRAPVLLTQKDLAGRFSGILEKQAAQVILIDADWETIAQEADNNLQDESGPDNLAYVIYTSGSTGKPKGVLVEHRSLINHNMAAARLFELSSADRVLQFASLSFDTAVEEIFPTWLHGAQLVLRPDGDLPTGEELCGWIAQWGLTVLDLPTAYWHEWASEMAAIRQPLPAPLRLVVVGGEKALPEKLALWQEIAGDEVAWINTYGPTEGTIIATSYTPRRRFAAGTDTRLPIGTPIDNIRVYVLDASRQPVPTGVRGELYIGGLGAARGYLNRPELTAERFLPDLLFGQPGNQLLGSRMYRTGDLVRWVREGAGWVLEFAGRVDDQIKIRGFRIEPGEIETVLHQHPEVRQAAVLPRKTGTEVRLAAYIVPQDPSTPPPAGEIRAFLKDRLPDYMIPAAFVFLEQLPLTTSGKVDRRALPEPADLHIEPDSSYVAPSTPAEITLAQIWQDVLGRPVIGVNDNFFALGGDSILSLQVVSRARQAGLAITPRMLFEHPTIAGLAEAAGTMEDADGSLQGEQAAPHGPYPLTPIQNWFFRLPLTNRAHWNQSILLELSEPLDPDHLQAALAALVDHHDALRSRFTQDEQGNWSAEVLPVEALQQNGSSPRLEVRDFSHLTGAEQAVALTAACEQLQASFALDKPPLIAAGYFWLGGSKGGRLLLAAHHLVVDGVSWRILLEDLAAALEQIQRGLPVALPPKSASFRQWALALQELAQSPDLLAELPYWQSAARMKLASLPANPPDGVRREAELCSQAYTLSQEDTSLLLHAGQNLHADITSLLLASAAWALRRWIGPAVIPVEMERHGRDESIALDVSRTAGWFTSAFPLALDLSEIHSPEQSLRYVKDSLRTMPREGLGFGLLAANHPDPAVREELQRLYFPPVSFNYLGQFDETQGSGSFSISGENRGAERDPQAPAVNQLSLTGAVINGRLSVEFIYHPQAFHAETIQTLIDNFAGAIQSFLRPSEETSIETISHTDFPLANLDSKKLKKVLSKIQQPGGKASR